MAKYKVKGLHSGEGSTRINYKLLLQIVIACSALIMSSMENEALNIKDFETVPVSPTLESLALCFEENVEVPPPKRVKLTTDTDNSVPSDCSSSVDKLYNEYCKVMNSTQSKTRTSNKSLGDYMCTVKNFMLKARSQLSISDFDELLKKLPSNYNQLDKCCSDFVKDVTSFVMCMKCDHLYLEDDCYSFQNGTKTPRLCSQRPHPNHPHKSKRIQKCNEPLMKEHITSTGKRTFHPCRLYTVKSLKSCLSELLSRPGFIDLCSTSTTSNDDELFDISDGEIFKLFTHDQCSDLLESPNNLLLQMNVDWFQPFDSPQSFGVIYASLLNLPKEIRLKRENVMLLGVISGPKEPKSLNSCLQPIVNELIELWDSGLEILSGGNEDIYKVALACVTCDIPACRKCCGFLSHNATKGCHRCLKEFPSPAFAEKNIYNEFDWESWEPRLSDVHISTARKTRTAKTTAEQDRLERQYGSRWSCLFELPYYDAVRFVPVDPMHNLLLGTAKNVMKAWTEEKVVDEKTLNDIQSDVKSFQTHKSMGSIPLKINSKFTSFTADEWKSWVTIFSVVVLHKRIPEEHFQCWSHFVSACQIIFQRCLTVKHIDLAHDYLVKFCRQWALLMGNKYCTINMHLHLHLKNCLLDFGPVYGFWLFAYERFNGWLKKTPIGGENIAIQYMRVWYRDWNMNVGEYVQGYTPKVLQSLRGIALSECFGDYSCLDGIAMLGRFKTGVLRGSSLSAVKSTLQTLDGNVNGLCSEYNQYKRIQVGFMELRSHQHSENYGTVVLAKWFTINETGNISIDPTSEFQAGRIVEIIQVHAMVCIDDVNQQKKEFILARVDWFKNHHGKNQMGGNAQIYCDEIESRTSKVEFIPIQRIFTTCATARLQVDLGTHKEKVRVVVPLKPFGERDLLAYT